MRTFIGVTSRPGANAPGPSPDRGAAPGCAWQLAG